MRVLKKPSPSIPLPEGEGLTNSGFWFSPFSLREKGQG
jgi:hypothetical protein